MDLQTLIGFGVAGNFTGHLEQAGEASDFVNIQAAAGAPKGVFPFYVPQAQDNPTPQAEGCGAQRQSPGSHFLHTFPLSPDTIEHPGDIQGQAANLQIEPELALLCELSYDDAQQVTAIRPTHCAAYNDCSTRRPDATKISQKKNWGPNTKGLASDQWLLLDSFDEAGILQHFRVACYLLRDGELHTYGEDSPVAGPDGYGYMYQQLLDWLIERFNTQQDEGPLEDLAQWLAVAGHPHRAVISIGATRYTELGETTFLQPGDDSIVVAYDQRLHNTAGIEAALMKNDLPLREAATCSLLRQRVIARP
ncbi:DUF5718 family protein [Algisphaera agarilytica]|uniref:DUF5718 family protein n=1 Tax=Algisphaera agarilytica TaxID=1385975 RepID=UPI0036F1A698